MKKLLFGLGIAALTLGSATITTSCGEANATEETSCNKKCCDNEGCTCADKDSEGCSKECKEKCEKNCSKDGKCSHDGKNCSKDSKSCSHDKKSCSHSTEGATEEGTGSEGTTDVTEEQTAE